MRSRSSPRDSRLTSRRPGPRAQANRLGAVVVDLLISLRPAWWVLRGYAAYQLIWSLFPTGVIAWATLLVLVAGSVWTGHHSWGPFGRVLIVAGNLLAVLVLLTSFAEIEANNAAYLSDINGDGYFYGDESEEVAAGLLLNGREVTNVFAYDAEGKLLEKVQLFGPDGEPIITSVPGGNGCLKLAGAPENPNEDAPCDTPGVWLPSLLETGAMAWNVFPMSMATATFENPTQAIPGAEAAKRNPPFVKVPAVAKDAVGKDAVGKDSETEKSGPKKPD